MARKISKAYEDQTSFGGQTEEENAEMRVFLEGRRREHERRAREGEEKARQYGAFLGIVGNIGRTTNKFKYAKEKIGALQTLGMRSLRGFGDFESMLLDAERGILDDKTKVAVSSVYQKAIKEADTFLVGYREKRQDKLF